MDNKIFKLRNKIYKQIDELEIMLNNNQLGPEKIKVISNELDCIRNHYDNIFIETINE